MFAASALVVWLLVASSEGSVRISPELLMVREGENVSLSCSSHQDWFFCLWRHPGGEKECSVQEGGERRRVCGGEERMEVRGSRRQCDLEVRGVRREDGGRYMCMMTQSHSYNTHQLWTHLEVAVPDSLNIQLVNKKNMTNNTVEVVEGETVEAVCGGGGGYPAAQYSWLVGDLVINSNRINFTGQSRDQTGTVLSCVGSQYNSYTGQLLYNSSTSITVLVLPAPLYLGLLSHSSSSLVTVSFVAAVLVSLTIILLAIFLVRRRKSPPGSLSVESGSCSPPSPIWTTKCQNKRRELSSETAATYQQKYLHPLSPSFMVTSTPVRTEHNFVINISRGLEQSFSSEQNQSIGEIAEGNFVSFSSSDLYCVTEDELSGNPNKQGELEEDQQEAAVEEDELLRSLCEKCRSSFCSNVSSSTLTLTPETPGELSGSNQSDTKTINVDDILSICESVATLETEDGEYDVAISDEIDIDIDTLEDKTNTNVLHSQDIAECN